MHSRRMTGWTIWVVAAVVGLASCQADETIGPLNELPVIVRVSGGGTGSGNVFAPDPVVGTDCNLDAGARTGDCVTSFQDVGGMGTFTLVATADAGSELGAISVACRDDNGFVPWCTIDITGGTVTITFEHQPLSGDKLFIDVDVDFNLPDPIIPLPPADGDVVLFDDFDDAAADARWAVEYSSTDPAITQTAQYVATGGYPDGYRHMEHDWQAAGSVNVRHFYQVRTFDPGDGGDCEISHLDYNEDRVRLLPVSSSGSIGANLVIRQDGQLFFLTGGTSFSSNEWVRLSRDGLTPADFTPAPGPDFTAAGGPMEFGYIRTNTTGSSVHHNEHGIDNWRFEIHCVP